MACIVNFLASISTPNMVLKICVFTRQEPSRALKPCELKVTHLLVLIRSFSVCGIVAKFYRDSAGNHPPADARFFLGDGEVGSQLQPLFPDFFHTLATLQSLFDFSIYDLAVQRLVTTIRVATDR